jgi:lysophospholipase L1-like esterase
MKWKFIILFFTWTDIQSQSKDTMHQYSYLALGDSYTIGEAIPLRQNFPYQAVQLLRNKGYQFTAPEIIAKTGWTTDELEAAVRDYKFLPKYDFVTLLIGVNNQYRGRNAIEYKEQLEELLKKAIELANGKKDHVILLSIPDYGATPFAASMDTAKIAKEVDVFNAIKKALSIQYKVKFIDITPGSKEARNDPALVAEDRLHPSSKEYTRWAEKLADIIAAQLK